MDRITDTYTHKRGDCAYVGVGILFVLTKALRHYPSKSVLVSQLTHIELINEERDAPTDLHSQAVRSMKEDVKYCPTPAE